MGLLDDAIREHLELKRRRGADPSDIARLEHEALGPVRREPFERANQEGAVHAEADDQPVTSARAKEPGKAEYDEYFEEEYYDEEGGDDWGQAFDDEFQRPASRGSRSKEPSPAPEEAAPEPASEPEPEHRFRRWRLSRRESVPPEKAPPTQAEPPEHEDSGEETVEYEMHDEPAAEGRRRAKRRPAEDPEEEADVLEETPEFLQDSPEHDRMWFEQRPPRDFDFDE